MLLIYCRFIILYWTISQSKHCGQRKAEAEASAFLCRHLCLRRRGKEKRMQEKQDEIRVISSRDGSFDPDNRYILQSQLEEYVSKELYPFHMPGHKRRCEPAPGLPFDWDVTEVPGTDDLHDASGILREAMERTAAQCGADRTWYLVNGSTCGLLAGIRALARRGDEVLCARNCHKAVYHALELAGCRVHWIMPPIDPGWGICGGISASQIEAAVRRHPSVRAVILTSPTYEGVLSDIRGICEICHSRNIPVLVDEAHGAHLLPVSERTGFPAGALTCGADIVVQSPHKTLPTLTQTALLHLQGNLADPERIENELDIFETSSPSYPLMASLDGCTGILRTEGEGLFSRWAARIGRFDTAVRRLRWIRILHHIPAQAGETVTQQIIPPALYDPGKILMDASAIGMTGPELAAILRDDWKMETEMARGKLVLAMTSLCDDEDSLDRLADALTVIEKAAEGMLVQGLSDPDRSRESAESAASPNLSDKNHITRLEISSALAGMKPVAVCTLEQARGQETVRSPLSDAGGKICAQYLYFYPPGIPFLAPGELITRDHIHLLTAAGRAGETAFRRSDGTILCLRE